MSDNDNNTPINHGHIAPLLIQDEMRECYLDYAMSVIVGRALPDVRDGLKPVHRRVLYAMHMLNNYHNRPFLKSARVVSHQGGGEEEGSGEATHRDLHLMLQPMLGCWTSSGSRPARTPSMASCSSWRVTRLASFQLSSRRPRYCRRRWES